MSLSEESAVAFDSAFELTSEEASVQEEEEEEEEDDALDLFGEEEEEEEEELCRIRLYRRVSPKEEEAGKTDAGFEVRLSGHHGQGLFATRAFVPGEVILRERPLILMPDAIFQLEDHRDMEVWMDKAINALDCNQRRQFFELSDSRSPSGDPTSLGIFFTNDMNFLGDAGLFPVMARVNHSCQPNADFVAREETGVQDLVATSSISAGEEVTLCYLPASKEASDVSKVRREYTHEWYGFVCRCRACDKQDSELASDDEIRLRLRRFQRRHLPEDDDDNDDDHEDDDDTEDFGDGVEAFLDGMIRIGTKLPYVVQASARLLDAVLEEMRSSGQDRRRLLELAVRIAVQARMAEDIVQDVGRRGHWEQVLRAHWVDFGDRMVLFPPPAI